MTGSSQARVIRKSGVYDIISVYPKTPRTADSAKRSFFLSGVLFTHKKVSIERYTFEKDDPNDDSITLIVLDKAIIPKVSNISQIPSFSD